MNTKWYWIVTIICVSHAAFISVAMIGYSMAQ